jgi:hypothetical protein
MRGDELNEEETTETGFGVCPTQSLVGSRRFEGMKTFSVPLQASGK